jgi:hypothetical protein
MFRREDLLNFSELVNFITESGPADRADKVIDKLKNYMFYDKEKKGGERERERERLSALLYLQLVTTCN